MPQEEYLPPTLVIQQGPYAGKSFPLDKDIVTIGSTEENDIVINNPDVSSHHALISKREGAWVIEDLGSKSGVWVNAKRVKQPVFLRNGTRINLGPNVILTAQGEALGVPASTKTRGCSRPTLLGLIGIVLLAIILLSSIIAVGYFYIYPQYLKTTAYSEFLPNLGPAVAIHEPAPGAEFPSKSTFMVFISARDPKGVTRIDLWIDDQIAITQSNPSPGGTTPFSLTHNMLTDAVGSHVLVAHAYNSEGQLGASPAIVVTVTDEQAATKPAMYIAEDGDTLEKIAEKTNNSSSDIKNANPGISGKVGKGRRITIPNPPHPPLPKPPTNAGSGIGKLPGIKPADIPGASKILPGFLPDEKVSVLLPNLLPGANVSIKDIVFPVNPPQSLKGTAKDCNVTLTWVDKATNNSEYQVYRRADGSPTPILVDKLPARANKDVDTVPGAGKYAYMVAAVNTKGPANKNGFSNYITVDVPVTDKCRYVPQFKQVHFQPLEFTTTDSSFNRAFLQAEYADQVLIRIPPGQQNSFPPGKLDSSYKRILPVSQYVYEHPDGSQDLTVYGNGIPADPMKPPQKLGSTYELISLNELPRSPTQKPWTMQNHDFILKYKVWLDNWKWTGQGTTDQYPPPTNLKMALPKPEYRELTWEYDPKYKDVIDGFILYRTYSCPGEDYQVDWPIPLSKDKRRGVFSLEIEPQGCTCKYQLSAFGPLGESKPSDTPKERCQTQSADQSIEVTFKTLRIADSIIKGPVAGEIYLFANGLYRKSNNLILEPKLYSLKNIPLNGRLENNSIIVRLGKQDGLQLSFAVTSLCTGLDRQIYPSDFTKSQSWEDIDQSTSIKSADGSCVVEIHLGDAGSKPGSVVAKDPTVYLPNGDSCTLHSQCRSGICSNKICVPDGDGKARDFCYTNAHCENDYCECPNGRDGRNCRDWQKFNTSYGGKCKYGKSNGDRCTKESDCASGYCANRLLVQNWRCAPKDKTGRLGDYCFHDEHCGNKTCYCSTGRTWDGYCKGWDDNCDYDADWSFCDEWEGPENGSPCKDNGDCKSNYCANGFCAPRDGSGLKGDYCHHQNHCYSGKCECPLLVFGDFCKDKDGGITAGVCLP
jgi:LysM repeat protein